MKRTARKSTSNRSLRLEVRVALRNWETDKGWRATMALQMRGSPRTLAVVGVLARSGNWRRRSLGLYIASQLRQCRGADVFQSIEYALEETQALLLDGLRDERDEVVAAAVSGFGHRPHPAALPELARLATHRDAVIRFNVAVALGGYCEPAAIDALLKLARDTDGGVRDWATFGLGTQQEADTPEIREFLWTQLQDDNRDVRGEAIVGLATRGDPRALAYLDAHLNADCLVYELEAAERLASPLILDRLQGMVPGVGEKDVDNHWLECLHAAIDACSSAVSSRPNPSNAG